MVIHLLDAYNMMSSDFATNNPYIKTAIDIRETAPQKGSIQWPLFAVRKAI
tara:strand:+ start:421 stop:573 length:153 start_codon:yes stop_codon:yes gene_type:complete